MISKYFNSHLIQNDLDSLCSLINFLLFSIHREKCVTGSLLELQEDIATKGIKFECIDDPR